MAVLSAIGTPREAAVAEAVARLAERLQARGWRLVTAESCTGGLIAAVCTDRPGSSAWFERGFVTYSNEAKADLLGVPADLLARHGAVSEPVARSMAEGALRHSRADLALSVTGIAGPGGAVPGKPVGTVFLGWAVRGTATATGVRRLALQGDRAEIRLATVLEALAQALDLSSPTVAGG